MFVTRFEWQLSLLIDEDKQLSVPTVTPPLHKSQSSCDYRINQFTNLQPCSKRLILLMEERKFGEVSMIGMHQISTNIYFIQGLYSPPCIPCQSAWTGIKSTQSPHELASCQDGTDTTVTAAWSPCGVHAFFTQTFRLYSD